MSFMKGFGDGFSKSFEQAASKRADKESEVFRYTYQEYINQRKDAQEREAEKSKRIRQAKSIVGLVPGMPSDAWDKAYDLLETLPANDVLKELRAGTFQQDNSAVPSGNRPVDQEMVGAGLKKPEGSVPAATSNPWQSIKSKLLGPNKTPHQKAIGTIGEIVGERPESVEEMLSGRGVPAGDDRPTSPYKFTPAEKTDEELKIDDDWEKANIRVDRFKEIYANNPSETNARRVKEAEATVGRLRALRDEETARELKKARDLKLQEQAITGSELKIDDDPEKAALAVDAYTRMYEEEPTPENKKKLDAATSNLKRINELTTQNDEKDFEKAKRLKLLDQSLKGDEEIKVDDDPEKAALRVAKLKAAYEEDPTPENAKRLAAAERDVAVIEAEGKKRTDEELAKAKTLKIQEQSLADPKTPAVNANAVWVEYKQAEAALKQNPGDAAAKARLDMAKLSLDAIKDKEMFDQDVAAEAYARKQGTLVDGRQQGRRPDGVDDEGRPKWRVTNAIAAPDGSWTDPEGKKIEGFIPMQRQVYEDAAALYKNMGKPIEEYNKKKLGMTSAMRDMSDMDMIIKIGGERIFAKNVSDWSKTAEKWALEVNEAWSMIRGDDAANGIITDAGKIAGYEQGVNKEIQKLISLPPEMVNAGTLRALLNAKGQILAYRLASMQSQDGRSLAENERIIFEKLALDNVFSVKQFYINAGNLIFSEMDNLDQSAYMLNSSPDLELFKQFNDGWAPFNPATPVSDLIKQNPKTRAMYETLQENYDLGAFGEKKKAKEAPVNQYSETNPYEFTSTDPAEQEKEFAKLPKGSYFKDPDDGKIYPKE